MNDIKKLADISAELLDLQSVMALTSWDQEVLMPPGAAQGRASQLALLSKIIHERQTSKKLGDLLLRLQEVSYRPDSRLTIYDRALIRVMQRSYDQAVKLPAHFVVTYTKLTSEAVHAWIDARKAADFSMFAPYLEQIVGLSRQMAEYLGYSKKPYDALLDQYEEGLLSDVVEKIFNEIKHPLIELLAIAEKKWNKSWEFKSGMDIEKQKEFCRKTAAYLGYDFNRGRLDTAPHPFMTSLGHDDRRITDRYSEFDLGAIFGVMHESGHAMYEQGIAKTLSRSALDTGVSLGMHESQSRMWENMIGRSRYFWEGYYKFLQADFPVQFSEMSLEDFYCRANSVRGGLIRTEADEISYNLHILIRFEIETGLIDGEIKVNELPDIWNAKYKDYLGVDVPNDASGVLQDIHWSHGTIGYFPTYTLGNLAAAQIWNTYTKYDPEYEQTLRSGNLKKIRDWMTENMYQFGSVFQPKELLQRICGEDLQSVYLINYLKSKYS